MNDLKIKNSAFKRLEDDRDYKWSNIGKAVEPFDWEKGFDLEEELGFKFPVKNQGSSYSCGGQAFSYYIQSLEFVGSKTFEERSAKFLYSQCWLNGGGSRARDICKMIKAQGDCREIFLPSYYQDGKPLSETDYQDTSSINNIIRNDAGGAKAIDYAYLDVLNINTVAQSAKANYGTVIGITGDNNGTWYTEFPEPPIKGDWGHWLFVIGAKLINGKKYIKVLNSWGEKIGLNGSQWISEKYFNTIVNGYNAVWEAWTIILQKTDEKNNLLRTLLLALLKNLTKK